MPQDIVSDRDAKFTSKAWKDFCKIFTTHQSMSTAYHPRTDGQSEVANKAIIQQIKKMVQEGDSNWLGQLPHIQSRMKRIRSSLRNATPYEITIGHNPRLIGNMSVKIPTQEETPTQRISRINQTQEIVKKRLSDARISQAIQSNKRRRPAPEVTVGNQVLLSTKNLPLATSYRKIALEWLGPLRITAAYPQTDNYTLRLPDDRTGIYRIFHVEVIKACIPNDNKRFPSGKNTKPGPLPEFEHEDRYEIERSSNLRPTPRKEPSITSLNEKVGDPKITHGNQLRSSTKKHLTSATNARKPQYSTSQQPERQTERGKHTPQGRKYWPNFFHCSFKRGSMQEYGILLHSRTYYCLLFSLYHMLIIFGTSY